MVTICDADKRTPPNLPPEPTPKTSKQNLGIDANNKDKAIPGNPNRVTH